MKNTANDIKPESQSEKILRGVDKSSTTLPPKKSFTNIYASIAVISIILVCSAAAYYVGTGQWKVVNTENEKSGGSEERKATLTESEKNAEPLFSDKIEKLSKDLGIVLLTEEDIANNIQDDILYYSAGKFTRGALKGYTRIIVVRPSGGPGEPLVYTVATKDFETYVLDDPEEKTKKFKETEYENPLSALKKEKIASVTVFDTEHPQMVALDDTFALYKIGIPTEFITIKKSGTNEIEKYQLTVPTNAQTYQSIDSPVEMLSLYSKPTIINTVSEDQMTPKEKENKAIQKQYFLTDTNVIAIDTTGLQVTYALTTKEHIATYEKKKKEYETAMVTYEAEVKKYQNKQRSDYPQSPEYVYVPSLGIQGSTLVGKNSAQWYSTYETAIPGACASSQSSRVMQVKESDLVNIGTLGNIPVYRLADTNHKLNSLAYQNKLEYYELDNEMWDQVNKGMKKPTFDEYMKNNPLIFFKDYWNRWIALGEYDIKLPGGCGKPVIYLYPTVKTAVSVEFTAPVSFTTNIPPYKNGWKVDAYPDGSLVDLHKTATDCESIDVTKRGSEYAAVACQNNKYPYLYWAGNIKSIDYVQSNSGWIVSKGTLEQFLTEKLTAMGFIARERSDFLTYWVPEMKAKPALYYKINFLSTREVDTLFPMNISPKPDTMIRMFMDYTPLVSMPNVLPIAPIIAPIERKGFTLVEWGGLKRP